MFTGAKATYVPVSAAPARTVGEGELLAVFRQGDRARERFVLKRAKALQHNEGIRAEATRLKAIHNNSEELDYRLDFVVDEGETEGLSWFVTRWVDGPLYTGAKASFCHEAGAPERKGGQAYVNAVNRLGDRSNARFALKKAKEAKDNNRIEAEARQLRAIHKICHAPDELVPNVLDEGETDGIRWFVMPWHEQNLKQRMDQTRGLEERLRWLARLARLVERFHSATGGLIVHHDIKPENVLVWEGAPEKLLLADFAGARGLGRLHAEESTVNGLPAFTTLYAPPESGLPQGEQAKMTADRFSLAASIFMLIAGQGCKKAGADPFTQSGQTLSKDHQDALNKHLSEEDARRYEVGKRRPLRELLNPTGPLLIPSFDDQLNDAVMGQPPLASAAVGTALGALRADLKVALSIIPDRRTVPPGQLALRLDALADALASAAGEAPAVVAPPHPVRQEVPSTRLPADSPPLPIPPAIEAPVLPEPQREPVPSVQAPRPLPRRTKAVPFTPPAAPPPVVAPPPPRVVVLPDPPQRPEPIAPPAEAPPSDAAPTPWLGLAVAAGIFLLCLVGVGALGALYIWSRSPEPSQEPASQPVVAEESEAPAPPVVAEEPEAPAPPPPPWERSDPAYLALRLPTFVPLAKDEHKVPSGKPEGTTQDTLTLPADVGLARTETPRRLYLSNGGSAHDAEIDYKNKRCGDLLPASNTDEVPITCLSPLEVVRFLNTLSLAAGYDEVYAVNEETNTITMNPTARGFRLPLRDEWVVGAWTWTEANTPRPRTRNGAPGPLLQAVGTLSLEPGGWALADPHGNAQELLWPEDNGQDAPALFPYFGGGVSPAVDHDLIDTISTYDSQQKTLSADQRRHDLGFRIAWGALAPTESP